MAGVIDLLTVSDRKSIARKYAAKYSLDAALVCSVAHNESNWNPWAIRYEPAFFSRYIQPMLNNGSVHTMTEANARATSWGLLQVMGQVARERGFSGPYLAELCDPDVGLEFGARKLKRCVDNHPGDLRAALLEWNGGGNPQYPDLVLQWMSKYQ